MDTIVLKSAQLIANSFGGALKYLDNQTSFSTLLRSIGITNIPTNQNILNLKISIENLVATLLALAEEPNLEDLDKLLSDINSVISASKSFDGVGLNGSISNKLISFLVSDFLYINHPNVFHLLKLIGIIGVNSTASDSSFLVTESYVLDFNKISQFLDSPSSFFSDHYAFLSTSPLIYKLIDYLQNIFNKIGFDSFYQPFSFSLTPPFDATLQNNVAIGNYALNTIFFQHILNGNSFVLGAFITQHPALYQGANGILIKPYTNANANIKVELSEGVDLILRGSVNPSDSILLSIYPNHMDIDNVSAAGVVSGFLEVELDIRAIENSRKEVLDFGGGSGIFYKDINIIAGFTSQNGVNDAYINALIKGFQIIVSKPEGSGFFSKIIPESGININSDLGISFSRIHGLHFTGTPGLPYSKVISLAKKASSDNISINSLTIGLKSNNNKLSFSAGVTGEVKLGPVEFNVENTGLFIDLDTNSSSPNLGLIDIRSGFKLPSGIGIRVESDAVKGGGYLYASSQTNQYAGVAQLTIRDKINLNAIGLLQTQLPDRSDEYSFLLLITAQFSPIQLGMGFTINGVGGLVGINRTASTNVLRGLVQNGQINTLLFPASVLSNPQAVVASVDNAFPATEGRHIFGIMAKIGWGVPNLITLEAALIIELPAPVRLILLGVLRATLPNESSAIVRLRADFIGIVDFGAKKIAFDAILVDSRILQFPLTGNFSFRLYQGDNPVFIMTAGGFHPAFHPPANADLPTMRRLTLALAQGGDFRLTLTSYLAITSNTVQFGSRLELFADLPGPFTLQGFLAFDALFRFNPFYLEVRIGAGVAIKKGSRSVLSLNLNLLVSGPAPWHVDGEGSFKILFFKVKFRFNRTFGGGATQPALPSTDLRRLLVAALEDKANWEVQQPLIKPANTVVLRTEDQPTELVVDPGGVLAVRQKVAPLGYSMQQYGNTNLTNGNHFEVSGVQLGTSTVSQATIGEIREAFAPGQFRRMSDGEKLSAPSFQLMRSGLRLNALDGLVGKEGQTRTFEFEQEVVAPASNSQVAGSLGQRSATDGEVAAKNTPVDGLAPDPTIFATPQGSIPPENMNRLARTGAVGRTRRSYEQRRHSRTAPDMVLWDEDSYALVSIRTLQPESTAPNPFRTEAEATAYLLSQLQANPALAGELQVVPVYQLDVSAPSATANLATV